MAETGGKTWHLLVSDCPEASLDSSQKVRLPSAALTAALPQAPARAAGGAGLLPTVPLAPACLGPFLALPSSLSLLHLLYSGPGCDIIARPPSVRPALCPSHVLTCPLSLLHCSSRHFSLSRLHYLFTVRLSASPTGRSAAPVLGQCLVYHRVPLPRASPGTCGSSINIG